MMPAPKQVLLVYLEPQGKSTLKSPQRLDKDFDDAPLEQVQGSLSPTLVQACQGVAIW